MFLKKKFNKMVLFINFNYLILLIIISDSKVNFLNLLIQQNFLK